MSDINIFFAETENVDRDRLQNWTASQEKKENKNVIVELKEK